MPASHRLGMLFQQSDLRLPLVDGGTFLEPGEPAFQKIALGFVLAIVSPFLRLMDTQITQLGVKLSLARQAHLALQIAIPFLKAIAGANVRRNPALLAAEPRLGAAIFMMADQPGVTPALLSALIQRHRETLAPVVAPRYAGRRGAPVLFDRAVFAEFAGLRGDVGGRPIIAAHTDEVAWLDWPTPEVIQDIDTPEDYRRAAGA